MIICYCACSDQNRLELQVHSSRYKMSNLLRQNIKLLSFLVSQPSVLCYRCLTATKRPNVLHNMIFPFYGIEIRTFLFIHHHLTDINLKTRQLHPTHLVDIFLVQAKSRRQSELQDCHSRIFTVSCISHAR